MTTQQQAFQQGAAWQLAYSLLFLGKTAKLFRTEDGEQRTNVLHVQTPLGL